MDIVSVVIPTYNRGYCIERAVDSALRQTAACLDVIVVDDGSTDDTVSILSSRYLTDPRVRWIRQENKGVAAARNTGLQAVRGDYVAFLDSDDIWKPWKLELQLACLRRLPEAGMIWTDMEAINPDGEVVSAKYLRTMYSAYQRNPLATLFDKVLKMSDCALGSSSDEGAPTVYSGDIFSRMVIGNLVHTSTVLMRRERLEQVGGFNENLKYSGEDYDFHLRTCLAGPVAFVDVSSIQYQIDCADQLTQPAYQIHMARNFLLTISMMIEQHRERIDLSDETLSETVSRGHFWVGHEALIRGEQGEARMHLLRSVLLRLRQPVVWGYLALACAPRFIFLWLRSSYRWLKRGHASRVTANGTCSLP